MSAVFSRDMRHAVARSSRSLGESTRTYERSSTAQIEPMPEPFHRSDRIVMWGSAVGAVALAALLLIERFA